MNLQYETARNNIEKLYQLLSQQISAGKFKLVIVVENKDLGNLKDMEHDNLYIRGVKFFAPDSATKDGADNSGWDKIMREFAEKRQIEEIENKIKNKTFDEILEENLRNYFIGLDENWKLEDLLQKYSERSFNEFEERDLEYFQENIQDIKENFAHYGGVYDKLADEKSREVYSCMMAAKFFMNAEYIQKAFEPEIVYFSKNIFSFSKDEVYIDCGGFNGDTALDFFKRNEDCKKIYVFEGMPDLAQKCREQIKKVDSMKEKTVVFQKAVYSQKGELKFNAGMENGDSKIDEKGTIKVESVPLDDMIHDKVTFIKMDIEGAEKEAIKGASRIIRENTPKMAICINHLKDDFWKIPELILSINPNYSFKVRQHDPVSFSETVLYCIPQNMPECCGEQIELDKKERDLIEYRKCKVWLMKQANERTNELIQCKKYCSELLGAKEYLEKRFEGQEKYIKNLLEGKKWLEKHSEEQEMYIKELIEAKEYLEKHSEELERYIKELLEGKEWLEKHSEEQERYIKKLTKEKSAD